MSQKFNKCSDLARIKPSRAIVAPVPAPNVPPSGRRFGWFGLAVAATLLLLHPGYDTTEGSYHAATALHWLETGQLGQFPRPAMVFLPGTDGLYYPAHELGAVLWHLPGAAAGLAVEAVAGRRAVAGSPQRAAAFVISCDSVLVATLIALGFWKWLEWGFAAPPRLCITASTLLLCTTMLLPYSRMLSDVGATGAWLIWGAAFGARAAVRGRERDAAAAGLSFGCALMTRLPAGVAVAPMFLVMLARSPRDWRWRQAVIAIAAALPSVTVILWFNQLRSGSMFIPGFLVQQFDVVQPGSGNLPLGATGLLFSPGKSMFVFSPALLLSVAGFLRLWRRARPEAAGIAAVFILFVLIHGSMKSWSADWGWGPRYAVFILPLLWLPAALLIGDLPRDGRRAAVTGVLALSLCVQMVPLLVNWQYQYQNMFADGRLDAGTPWRADNQLTDAARAAAANLARTFGADLPARAPLPDMSRLTAIASTGVNVWWVTALRSGLPPLAIWSAVALIGAIAWIAWRRAWPLAPVQ